MDSIEDAMREASDSMRALEESESLAESERLAQLAVEEDAPAEVCDHGNRDLLLELLDIVYTFNDLELLPVLFKARRIKHGKAKYGPMDLNKRRDWALEMAEEADDFVNYYLWWRADQEGRDRE